MLQNTTTAMALLLVLLAGCQSSSAVEEDKQQNQQASDIPAFGQVVEASCGQCQFGMEGDGCTLAVRIDGETYFVDGSSIDDHGDAHGEDGMCNCVRKARVQGEIVDGRFVASVVELIPESAGDE